MIVSEKCASSSTQFPQHHSRRRISVGSIWRTLAPGPTLLPWHVLALTFLLPVVSTSTAADFNGTDTVAEELWSPIGLYFRTGRDDAALEAPLVKTEVEISVSGIVARVHLRQQFLNPSNQWLEGVYVYPLPERSAVDRLIMKIGDRLVEGRIMAREEARKIYIEAAEDGRRASLVSEERPNIFTTAVANIGPGNEITIEVAYQDTVSYRDGKFTLRFPMVVAPRFVPPHTGLLVQQSNRTVRQAAIDGQLDRDPYGSVRHPEAGQANPLSLVVSIDGGLPIDSVRSLYHRMDIARPRPRFRKITLAGGKVPANRDFVVEWQTRSTAAPEATVFMSGMDDEKFAMIMVVPPNVEELDRESIPRDLVFVIDTSGSMHGTSIEQAKDAILFALDRLGSGDRFNVIRFADDTEALFPNVQRFDANTLRRARAYVGSFRAQGGTMMGPALERAFEGAAAQERLRQIVFLTDGAVGNEAELFRTISLKLGPSRLFTIGIGSAPNTYFMRRSAEIGRGTFTYIGARKSRQVSPNSWPNCGVR